MVYTKQGKEMQDEGQSDRGMEGQRDGEAEGQRDRETEEQFFCGEFKRFPAPFTTGNNNPLTAGSATNSQFLQVCSLPVTCINLLQILAKC